MNIGKYEVEPRAEGSHEGGFSGYLLLTWDEGNTTYQKRHEVDGIFPTLGEAIENATRRASQLREEDL